MAAVIVILFSSCKDQGSRSGTPAAPLESYVEAELLRLEEAYRILDRFSEELWPGWTDYADIPVQVGFPNGVVLLVTPRAKSKPGFERLDGWTILGKACYISKPKQTTVEVRPPLFARMGRGGELIQLEMAEPDLPALEAERSAALEAQLEKAGQPDTPFNLAPHGDSDAHILMYVHEHFHGHQARVGRGGPRGPGDEAWRRFEADAEYASWSNVEGLALRRAYLESEDAAAREFLKDFVVARENKNAHMPAGAAPEAYISAVEGTSTYVSFKTALLLGGSNYSPDIDRAKDPYFYKFAHVDGYIDNIMRKGMDFAVAWSQDTRSKYYLYGAYQCFLLDRFAPGWKRGFIEKAKSLDAAMADLLRLSSAEKEEIRQRLPTRYAYDEIFSFHENALKKKGPK
jgi:hypothetical protein